jgi:hypothetical protein
MIIKVNDELFLVKRITGLLYETHASLWNEVSEAYRSFKKDNKMFFCELIEEALIEEITTKE